MLFLAFLTTKMTAHHSARLPDLGTNNTISCATMQLIFQVAKSRSFYSNFTIEFRNFMSDRLLELVEFINSWLVIRGVGWRRRGSIHSQIIGRRPSSIRAAKRPSRHLVRVGDRDRVGYFFWISMFRLQSSKYCLVFRKLVQIWKLIYKTSELAIQLKNV